MVANTSPTRTGLSRDVHAVGVGRAVGLAALDGAAADHDRPAARPVIAAGVLVDARRAAELAHPHEDGVLPHAAIDQVLTRVPMALSSVRLQAGAVGVEGLVVRVPAAQGDLDRGDAGFDQAAGQEGGAAEVVGAVPAAPYSVSGGSRP